MTIIGNIIGNDLPLLKLDPASFQTTDEHWDYQEQLHHHCMRQTWMRSVGSNRPIRDVFSLCASRAYMAYYRACGWEITADALASALDDARRDHEILSCLGFLVEEECGRILRDVTNGIYPTPYSFFTPMDLRNLPLQQQPLGIYVARDLLYMLEAMWGNYQERAASDPLTCETIRIVSFATGRDANLSQCRRLSRALSVIESAIEALEAGEA